MNLTTYDPTDAQSIFDYAEGLIGKSLRETLGDKAIALGDGKGDLGTMVERFYYGWNPPNNHEPDFPDAGLELKTTGVKINKGILSPKERLVLSMISYFEVVNEDFYDSYLIKKIRLMLVLFYLYEKQIPPADRKFLARKLWRLSEKDLILIEKDWNLIVNKIKAGKAHELSEGDTLYLGACTKSADGAVRTAQPNSTISAKPRAFSFKAGYIKVLFEEEDLKKQLYQSIIQDPSKEDLIKATLRKLSPFIGQTFSNLLQKYGQDLNPKSKNVYALLVYRLLGVQTPNVEEFKKADLIIKTIRIAKSGRPKEDISFPAFKYTEIINQQWDESDFKSVVESKFLFIIFEEDDKDLVFKGAKFWNMPYGDRLEAERVWAETVSRIKKNNLDLPSKKFSDVAHVRPHGRNKKDVFPLPFGGFETKKCFWINASYIKEQLKSNG